MDKELKIIPPEGYEVDEEHSTLECIKFRPIKPQLPKTWEEFCEVYPIKKGEAYINNVSMVVTIDDGMNRSFSNKNTLPSEKMAEAVLALCQLLQLRDYYNNGWKPNWTYCNVIKYCLSVKENEIIRETLQTTSRVLAFETMELREEFLKNFKDLLKIAKPLL